MQTNNTDHGKHLKDEDGVNFRPSPNFKHMKKYLKSKFEESVGASGQSATERESGSSADAAVEEAERGRGAVQPPLPPHPPPPDSPPHATLKTEREDDEYEPAPRVEPTMCRQFARGACTRGESCIYAHEIILSQLHGVYTFCKNFQNAAGCNLPKCKFVHATVFEKEYFYRTGYMPPHALAHIKDTSAQPAQGEGGQGPTESAGSLAGVGAPAAGLQVVKQKVESALRSNEEMNKKMALLSMKSNKLNAVIAALMKTSPPVAPLTNGSAGPSGSGPVAAPAPPPVPSINVRNEKEINGLVDQLKLRFGAGPGVPPPPQPLHPHALAAPADDTKGRGGVPPALVRLLLKGLPAERDPPPPDPRH